MHHLTIFAMKFNSHLKQHCVFVWNSIGICLKLSSYLKKQCQIFGIEDLERDSLEN